jgi:hypothetical protein
MNWLRKLVFSMLFVSALLLSSAVPAFASNVCPVTGGPNDPTIKSTPAEVPDKSGNPAHGEQDDSGTPVDPQPGDAFWN